MSAAPLGLFETLRGAIESARAEGPAKEGRAWATLAIAYAAAGDPAKAHEALAESEARVHAAGKATDEAGKRDWLRLRGTIADARGRIESGEGALGRAVDSFAEAAHLASESGDRELRAGSLLALAASNAHLGKVLDAALQAEESEDLFVETGSPSGDVAARALADRLATSILQSDDLSAAADEDLAAERKEGKDPRRLGWRLRATAACFLATGEEEGFEDAYALLDEAAAAFRLAESRAGEASAIRSQGHCLGELGEAAEAADAFLEAAAIYAEIDAKMPQARAMLEAGNASSEADDVRRAGECFESAAAIFGEHAAAFQQGFAIESLADLRLAARKAAPARSLYEKALALYEGTGDKLDDQRAGCLLSLGTACREMGDLPAAEKRLGEARAIYERTGEVEMASECDRELRKVARAGSRG